MNARSRVKRAAGLRLTSVKSRFLAQQEARNVIRAALHGDAVLVA